MKYTPKSEDTLEKEKQDAINSSLYENGEYDFEVLDTSDKASSSGADMITLKLNVFDNEGRGKIIFDYLTESMGWKLRHAADACGLLNEYEQGNLAAHDFASRTGKVKIKTQKGNKDYPNPKNVVEDYVKRGEQAMPVVAMSPSTALNNDEIPF